MSEAYKIIKRKADAFISMAGHEHVIITQDEVHTIMDALRPISDKELEEALEELAPYSVNLRNGLIDAMERNETVREPYRTKIVAFNTIKTKVQELEKRTKVPTEEELLIDLEDETKDYKGHWFYNEISNGFRHTEMAFDVFLHEGKLVTTPLLPLNKLKKFIKFYEQILSKRNEVKQ